MSPAADTHDHIPPKGILVRTTTSMKQRDASLRVAELGASSGNSVGSLRSRGASVGYSVRITTSELRREAGDGKKGDTVVEAQASVRAFTAARLRRALFGILSLAAVVFGLVAMHAGMAAESEASPHSHAMLAAHSDPSAPSTEDSELDSTSASFHGTSDLPSTCLGMCTADCLMTGSACTAGPIAHSPNSVAQHAIPIVVDRSAERAVPAVARRLPLQRPPSLTVLSISRV
ncbi:hypothetical protein RCH22_000635 [Cryobacterium psychrotolerans]|nr:hypothetical protein [Cryobacterium psychrotolerans]